jgi:hypothetical protein
MSLIDLNIPIKLKIFKYQDGHGNPWILSTDHDSFIGKRLIFLNVILAGEGGMHIDNILKIIDF